MASTEKPDSKTILQTKGEYSKGGKSLKSTMTKNTSLGKSKVAYLQTLNESEKAENFKIIDNMNKWINFLWNPRYTTKSKLITCDKAGGLIQKTKEDISQSPFIAEPNIVMFTDYTNGVYEIPLKLINKSSVSHKIKIIPPKTEHFSIRKVKKPSESFSNVAPGMSIIVYVIFHAPSFAEFEDKLTIITKDNQFDVPIKAKWDPPVIKLINPLDCKSCWVGDKVDMVFWCMNTGGDGGFKFFCEKDEDDSL